MASRVAVACLLAGASPGAVALTIEAPAKASQFPFGGNGGFGGFGGFGNPGALGQRTEEATTSGLSLDISIGGARAKDIPDIDYTGCRKARQKRGGDIKYTCKFHEGDSPPAHPVDVSETLKSFAETFNEGDTVTFEDNVHFQNVPPALAMMVPADVPSVKLTCPMCGGQCDTSLKTVSPGLFDMLENMKPMIEQMAAMAGGGESPLAAFEKRQAIIDMPPCPLLINADTFANRTVLPKEVTESATPGQIPPQIKAGIDMLKQVTGGMSVNSDAKLSFTRADGSSIFNLFVASRAGRI